MRYLPRYGKRRFPGRRRSLSDRCRITPNGSVPSSGAFPPYRNRLRRRWPGTLSWWLIAASGSHPLRWSRQGPDIALPGDFVGYAPMSDSLHSHGALAITDAGLRISPDRSAPMIDPWLHTDDASCRSISIQARSSRPDPESNGAGSGDANRRAADRARRGRFISSAGSAPRG